MKTIVKTSIKGNENLTVKESVEQVFEKLIDKNSFIMLTQIDYSGKKYKLGIKKTTIKMFKQSEV